MSNTPELSRIVWDTQRSDSQEVRSKRLRRKRWGVYRGCRVLADRLKPDTDGHDPSLFVSVRLSGSPIARDLEKYTEVFTESVKCRRIDSIGHDPSLFVSVRLCGSPIARDLEKYTEVFTEEMKCWRSYSIGHGPSFRVSSWLTRTPIARYSQNKPTKRVYVVKAWVYHGERHRTHRCKSYVGATKPIALAITGSAVRCTLTWFFQVQPAIITLFPNCTSWQESH